MSNFNQIRQDFYAQRTKISEVNSELQKAQASLENLMAEKAQVIKGLDLESQNREIEIYKEKEKTLFDTIKELSESKKNRLDMLEGLSFEFYQESSPVDKIVELKDSFPILMFPLRLETRFKTAENKQQLWLRVFPDDCNVNKKEELLSASELKNVKLFWIEIWKAGGIESEERGAWQSLVNNHGSGRSSWLIEQFKPINIAPKKLSSEHKILVVTSDLILTNDEKKNALDYWSSVWLANGNQEKIDDALVVLKTNLGEAKSKEILEKYIPENINDSIPKNIKKENIQIEKLELPNENDFITTQTTWTQAPKATGMPDRFVAIGFANNKRRNIPFENHVTENLSVGPDPSLTKEKQIKKDEHDDLVINEDLKWMVDFDEAVKVGMATKITLESGEINGFDKLFVVGLRFSSHENDSKEILEKLITDHFHSKNGFELLKQGTPTNNTEDEPAGYSWTDNADESYERIFKKREDFRENDDYKEKTDGQKLAENLGINPDILKKVPNASGRDQLEANAMNTALFAGTMGYFMEEMMQPLFSDRDIEATQTFFSNFVSGRGPIPAIRIGKQPYGILPISVYSKLNFLPTIIGSHSTHVSQSKIPFLYRLHQLIMKMDSTWDALIPQVAFVGKEKDEKNEPVDVHQNLMDVLTLQANSIDFHQRYSQGIHQLYNLLNLQNKDKNPNYAEIIKEAIVSRGRQILTLLKIEIGDSTLPILEKFFLSTPNHLEGPLVDDVLSSEINPIRPYTDDGRNYIEWLVSTGGDKMRLEDFGKNEAPIALLYLLLKHALLLSQSDAGIRVMISKELIANKSAYYDKNYINVQSQENVGKSKFEHLYGTKIGNDNQRLVDYLYQPSILRGIPETKKLRDSLDALKILEKTPTARLERLFVEHLDCCNYRLDAWKTGLVQYKLSEIRATNNDRENSSKGLYLGAYGWLIEVRPKHNELKNVELSDELKQIFNKNNLNPLQTDSSNLGYIHAPSLNQATTAAILRNAYDSNKNKGTENQFAINLTSNRVRIAQDFLEGIRNGQRISALLGYQFERGLHDKYSLGNGEVDKFIYPLRKAFPLVADKLLDTKSEVTDNIETIQSNNVIDGMLLINYIKNSPNKSYPFGLPSTLNLPIADAIQTKAINDEVARIMDIYDAVSDLLISEQVYQVVQGNIERTSGNAEAFSKGGYPPEIDVVNTPRSGVTLTQKMAIHFDSTATISPLSESPRAVAEPSVNQWLISIFPKSENVFCHITYSTPNLLNKSEVISLKELQLEPIDLLYCFDLETKQAMTELDDRITNYVRYSKSLHPKTDLKINYTLPIDELDKTKISFFELSALVKSVRKILIGSKYLNASMITLSENSKTDLSIMDDVKLKNRVTGLITKFDVLKNDFLTLQNIIKTGESLTNEFKIFLGASITDKLKIESICINLKSDLKTYLIDSSTKNKILEDFEKNVRSIEDVAINANLSNLKNEYSSILDKYLISFSKFDEIVESTTKLFLKVSKFNNTQTGIGFIHQSIAGMYESVFLKVDKIVERWNKKNHDFITQMSDFDATSPPEIQFELLIKVERIISTKSDFTTLITPANFKNIIDLKKADFDDLLTKLKSILKNNSSKVTDFITDTETIIKQISPFDLITFDIENSRNDLKNERLMIDGLKEDIKVAIENLNKSLINKIELAQKMVLEANQTVNNFDKINSLLNASKTILGEEALILPHFKLNESKTEEFNNSYQNSDKLLKFLKEDITETEKRIFPVEDWLGGVARVREKGHVWENITFLSDAFSSEESLELTPMQFPFQADDRWLAMKFRVHDNDEFKINTDKLLYTAHFTKIFDKTESICGILMDEWTEVIPAKEETTGITFHYDQPNSEPPQTMLLFTPPEIKGHWKWDDIVESMDETLEMAKKRAVEPSQIEKTQYAQFLPTTMMAVTLHWITVATNLAINNRFSDYLKKE